jgi:hypothetical protein
MKGLGSNRFKTENMSLTKLIIYGIHDTYIMIFRLVKIFENLELKNWKGILVLHRPSNLFDNNVRNISS